MIYFKYFKRVLDVGVTMVLLVVLFPVLLLTWLLLTLQNRGSAFFIQLRPGLYENAFYIVKFKTMTDRRDPEGNLLPDNERLTPFGKIIRKLSIDELPQLLNVLKGEMSLIGPRPLLFKYIPLYQEDQKKRHMVRPGITGWAQVNGRNSISWSEKFRYDVYYVENVTFFLDLKILWLTFLKVVKREGINQSSDRPMSPFNGLN